MTATILRIINTNSDSLYSIYFPALDCYIPIASAVFERMKTALQFRLQFSYHVIGSDFDRNLSDTDLVTYYYIRDRK